LQSTLRELGVDPGDISAMAEVVSRDTDGRKVGVLIGLENRDGLYGL
jgi:hypothetical protein